jgi:hypothetical protein
MRLRVDQRFVDPVGHLLGAAQPVVVAREKYRGRTVGRRVEELVLLAPRDAAAVLGHPRVDELITQFLQPAVFLDAGQPARTLQRQRQPGHVVVVVVDPSERVAHVMRPDLAADLRLPRGLRIA